MKCDDCGKDAKLETYHIDSGGDQMLCDECGGFPHHEYRVSCPHCDKTILVN